MMNKKKVENKKQLFSKNLANNKSNKSKNKGFKKLKIFETFAGIGAQNKAITRINKKQGKDIFEVVATSEWDIYCNISYNEIHKKPIKHKLPSLEKMKEFLLKFTWSKDTKEPITKRAWENLSPSIIKKLYKSVVAHNNLGSITKLSAKELIDKVGEIDIITYSFPCQNLSTAGAFYNVNIGMSKEAKSRSGLLWEIERILLELKEMKKLPKYLILENVKAMLFQRNKKDYDKWLKALEKIGYKTNTQTLNALDFGIPQSRERVFAISILSKYIYIYKQDKLEIEYSKSSKIKPLKEFIKINKTFLDEYLSAEPNDTPSRTRMRKNNPYLEKVGYCRTITTKQDRHPNSGTIFFKEGKKRQKTHDNESPWRFLTPRESFMLMGFESSDYSKIKKAGIKNQIAYLQAGNSIVVNILESIFQKIYDIETKGLYG